MNTSEVLNKAADLIEERGWESGTGWPGVGAATGLCLEGGIMAALGVTFVDVELEEFWACPAYRAVQSHLSLSTAVEVVRPGELASPVNPLWRFNDRQGTAERVIEVLRATAVIEAAREDAALLAEVNA